MDLKGGRLRGRVRRNGSVRGSAARRWRRRRRRIVLDLLTAYGASGCETVCDEARRVRGRCGIEYLKRGRPRERQDTAKIRTYANNN